MYHLMTVLTLLDLKDITLTPSFGGILKTRQLYLNFFQRKLKAAECSYIDYASFRDHCYKTFYRRKLLIF